ncbi:hypothetical protein LJK88_49680 [Paenibacillus sp. P26]|nr:hypothetical protein LJK88_49680 [Paenibacillus sp. P26]
MAGYAGLSPPLCGGRRRDVREGAAGRGNGGNANDGALLRRAGWARTGSAWQCLVDSRADRRAGSRGDVQKGGESRYIEAMGYVQESLQLDKLYLQHSGKA